MAFRVGQKVVCVNASPKPNWRDIDYSVLTEGAVYIVRSLDEYDRPEGRPVRLDGIYQRNRRGGMGGGQELGWCPSRFRPVIEKSTDAGMAILREILDRESHDEREPARVS